MNIYCTLDTETFGGASKPKGIYHLGGIIHNRKGEILATFNYLILEHYDQIAKDSYAKKNFNLYLDYVNNGVCTAIPTEQEAINQVKALYEYFNVKYSMAFNTGFDFCKTMCCQLLEISEFIDIQLMAVLAIGHLKKYQNFCEESKRYKKCYSTTAESFYAFISGDSEYKEEHTAFEDSKIEMQIFLECLRKHQKIVKNCHTWDYDKKQIFLWRNA